MLLAGSTSPPSLSSIIRSYHVLAFGRGFVLGFSTSNGRHLSVKNIEILLESQVNC